MRIGELAALAGVSTRTVRHYHHVGLLPEPDRRDNGYRSYGLRDVVLLIRARRLVELGLCLSEVGDVLAKDSGRDLMEILAELDADLAARQQSLQTQRDRIAMVLAADGDTRSPGLLAAIHELTSVLAPDDPGLARETLIAEVVDGMIGDQLPNLGEVYQQLLADPGWRQRVIDLSRRFEQLAALKPTDPAVTELAREAGELGVMVPAGLLGGSGDSAAPERLLAAITADMPAAQAQCLALMIDYWKRGVG